MRYIPGTTAEYDVLGPSGLPFIFNMSPNIPHFATDEEKDIVFAHYWKSVCEKLNQEYDLSLYEKEQLVRVHYRTHEGQIHPVLLKDILKNGHPLTIENVNDNTTTYPSPIKDLFLKVSHLLLDWQNPESEDEEDPFITGIIDELDNDSVLEDNLLFYSCIGTPFDYLGRFGGDGFFVLDLHREPIVVFFDLTARPSSDKAGSHMENRVVLGDMNTSTSNEIYFSEEAMDYFAQQIFHKLKHFFLIREKQLQSEREKQRARRNFPRY